MSTTTTQSINHLFATDSLSEVLFMCILYVVLGIISILANILNIAVFLSNKDLRKNYIFHVVLDVAEILNGLSLILTGTGRAVLELNGQLSVPTSIHDCLFKHYWPIFLILGTQSISIITMIMSFERVIAVHKPAIYKYHFTTKTKIGLVLLAICVQMLLILAAVLTSMDDYSMTSSQKCAIISSTVIAFSTFHFIFIVFGYVVSFYSLTIIYFLHKKATQGVDSKKGPKLLVFIFITALDAVLLSSYSIVMLGANFGFFAPNDITISLVTSTTGLISLIHTAMNFIFHEQYRIQIRRITRRILGLPPLSNTATVVTKFGAVSTFQRGAAATKTVTTAWS